MPHLEICEDCRTVWSHAADAPTVNAARAWTIGRYEVRGTLGAGGVGVVLLGWDPVLHREVALKFTSARGASALREAQALAAIRHRNVVAVHDFGEADGDVYITMERAVGVTFETWWLGEGTAARVKALLDVAAGLCAIHAAGLVHCDLKPRNIVVTPGGDVVIVDLGLATASGASDASSGGTPGFVAPELARGAPPAVTSDVYAFWCVARHGLAAAPMTARQRRALDALIARGTSDDPAQRFGSARESAEALRALFLARRGARMMVAAALVVVGGAAAVLALRAPSATCASAPPAWPAFARARWMTQHPEVRGRVEALVAREGGAGEALLAGACEADAADAVALRTRWCVGASWRWTYGRLLQIADGGDVPDALDELLQGVPAESCAPGRVTASPPAVPADATPASRFLHAVVLAESDALPAARVRRLTALAATIDGANNPGLAAAWNLELADAHERMGDNRAAEASAQAAVEIATRNGDDLVLARARLSVYMLRDAADRSAAVRDQEIEAVVARAGSPGLMAMFHNAAGLRATAQGDIPRARAQFERAIAAFAEIELAPASFHGAAEQNLGVALQYAGDLEAAQAHFDRASALLTERFGPRHVEVLGARLASGLCQLYRGHVAEAGDTLDRLADEVAAAGRSRTTLGANLAMARCQAAQAKKADPLTRCREALAIGRAVFGTGDVANVPALLAVAQLVMRESARDALPMLEEAIAIAERQANHPTDLPYARGLYALALKVAGRAREGEAIARAAIDDLERLGQAQLVAALRTHFSL